MLRIRFKRVGKKHQASYRLVVSERTKTPFAKAREEIGWYNSQSKKAEIDKDRAKYWLSVGAIPSDTVHNLFVKEGVIEGKKVAVHSQPRKDASEAEAQTPAPADQAKATEETPTTTEAPAEEKKEEVKEEKPKEEAPAEEKKEEEASPDSSQAQNDAGEVKEEASAEEKKEEVKES